MAPAEQDDTDDDHDSGLDGGSGGSDIAGLDGGAAAAVDDNLGDLYDDLDAPDDPAPDWVGRSGNTSVAQFPENSLSAENLARFDQTAPRPSTLGVRIRDGRRQFFVRLRGDRGQSSEQQDTPQVSLAQGSEQPVLRLRGASGRIREQQDIPQDGPVQSSEQQGIASHDDPSKDNSATDAASDAGQDE